MGLKGGNKEKVKLLVGKSMGRGQFGDPDEDGKI
jgi:hypothetical protein